MSQLRMYWLPGSRLPEVCLPEGYTVSSYAGAGDVGPWLECCRNGLIGDRSGEEVFISAIANHPDICPEEDVLFLDHGGEHIGTVTAVYHPGERIGEVHMVSLRRDYRGRGLGGVLNAMALQRLVPRNPTYIYLSTDAWRKSAVRSYIRAGFVPVDCAEVDMLSRWKEALAGAGVAESDYADEGGKVIGRLRAYRRNPKTAEPGRKPRVGVFGIGRGQTMADFCRQTGEAELAIVCDASREALAKARGLYGEGVRFTTDFDELLEADVDMIVLANYANEHAPYAVRCLEKGVPVLSEVLPVETMRQAVELIEAVERTGCLYGYAENYCFMNAPRAMRKLYREGRLGAFEYGEGEYMHNCEPDWHRLTHGDPEHWRNTMYSTYYCTHSIGPLIHATGLRPARVTGFEMPFNERMRRMGAKAGFAGLEIIELENGAYLKSAHGVGPSRNSVWYSLYGSKGRLESPREDAQIGGAQKLYVNLDGEPWRLEQPAQGGPASGHGGSDYWTMHNFLERLKGDAEADIVDVYEAMDMFLPGMFAHRSVLAGGRPMEIPNLRSSAERDRWRDDTFCTNPRVAGDQLAPSLAKGAPDIPRENYERLRAMDGRA